MSQRAAPDWGPAGCLWVSSDTLWSGFEVGRLIDQFSAFFGGHSPISL
jgi:hypothetical protein